MGSKSKRKKSRKKKNEINLSKRDDYLNDKMKNNRNESNSINRNNNKNVINISYNIKKNKKFIDITNDDIEIDNNTFTKDKLIKMPNHQPIKNENFKKNIIRMNKDKSNNEKKIKQLNLKMKKKIMIKKYN